MPSSTDKYLFVDPELSFNQLVSVPSPLGYTITVAIKPPQGQGGLIIL